MEEIVKSVIVRADDFQHLIKNLFHLPHQCELGAGAVEVVIRASNMEIMVALQIVGQDVAEHMIEAERYGLASHGVTLLPKYLENIARGDVTANAPPGMLNK